MDTSSNIITVLWAIYNSAFFSVVKFILGIYAIVLLADIVLMLIQRGLSGDMRDTRLGMYIPPEMVNKKSKLRKKWTKLQPICKLIMSRCGKFLSLRRTILL